MVDNLRRILTAPASALSTPVTSLRYASPPVYVASPMANPAPYYGLVEDNGFLLQCLLALEMQPHHFPTEKAKISFILSLLSGRALLWAETLWSQAGPVTQSFDSFTTHFWEVL